MAVTLTVLYTVPDDPADFDRHYRDVHMPIVAKWQGVESVELTRIDATMGGAERYHLMTQIRFPDRATLDAALGSEAGAEAGRDFGSIAAPGSFMLIGETD